MKTSDKIARPAKAEAATFGILAGGAAKPEPMFSRSRPREMAAAIRHYIEDGIATNKLRHGDKLPNERELAVKFGVGRNTVRKLLVALEKEGKIYRHVGQGTFIAASSPNIPNAAAAVLSMLGANGQDVVRIASPLDLMELRLIMEPQIAELAAHRAGLIEIERMQHCVESSKEAKTLEEFEEWDDVLHRTIAAASRNPLFIAISEIITAVRTGAEWGILKKQTLSDQHKLLHLSEHIDLVNAIKRRDAGATRREMERHLKSVRDTMFER